MSRGASLKAREPAWCRALSPRIVCSPAKGEMKVTRTSTATSVELTTEDQPEPVAAALTGKVELHDGDDGRVDIDAIVPSAVATEMLRVAAELFPRGAVDGLAWLRMLQGEEGGLTSFAAEVPPHALAALLAPAEAASVKIVDGRGRRAVRVT
jgi:hypothetical protein